MTCDPLASPEMDSGQTLPSLELPKPPLTRRHVEAQGASSGHPRGTCPGDSSPAHMVGGPGPPGTGLGKESGRDHVEAPQQQPSSGGPRPSHPRSLGVYGLTQSRQLRAGLKSSACSASANSQPAVQGFPSRLGLKGADPALLHAPTGGTQLHIASHPRPP